MSEKSLIDRFKKKDWELKSLGDIAIDIISGNGVSKSQLGTGTYPAIKCGDINSKFNYAFTECVGFVNPELIRDKTFCEKGDILVSHISDKSDSEWGVTVYLGNEKPLAGKNIYVVKHNQNPKFLSYMLNSRYVVNQLRAKSIDSIILFLSKTNLQKIKIPLPPRDIQDQMVECLDKWTNLESQLEQELEQRKKQYYYYKESLLNSGMNKWEIVSLDKVSTEITKGKEVTKIQLGTGDYPAIRYAEIFKNPISIENCVSKINSGIIKNPNYCNCGDLLISGTSENLQDSGKAIVYAGNEKPIVGSDILLLRHAQNGKFLSYVCSSKYVRDQFRKIAAGTTVIHVYKSTLKHIKIPLPSLEEQNKIVEILDKFHTITESFKNGLPSLIEKHRQQYIYYKEKILKPEIPIS